MPDTTIIQVIGDESDIEVLTEDIEIVHEVDDFTILVEESVIEVVTEDASMPIIVEETVMVIEDVTDDVIVIENLGVGPQGPPGPSGSGVQEVFVGATAPTDLSYPLIWIETGLGTGSDFSIWFNEV